MKRFLATMTAVAHLGVPSTAPAATPPLERATPAPEEPVLSEPVLTEAMAQQAAGALNAKPDAGGLTPCLLTCYLGPRVGTEYNEGRGVATLEWLLFPGRLIYGVQAYQGRTMSEWARDAEIDTRPIPPARGSSTTPGGAAACFIGACLGPRAAFERNEGRRLRTKEILYFIPVVNVFIGIAMGLEAYNGKTMTQIAQDEGLDG